MRIVHFSWEYPPVLYGGLGTFVFQGIGQWAIDLVLLGAIPIVILAFGAAVLLDACAEALDPVPA